jgi:ATP synthase subunit 6
MIINTIILNNNSVFLDPLGQFEVLNNLTSPLNLISGAIDFFANTANLKFVENCSDFFQNYITVQLTIFQLNLFCGLKLLPFLVLEPNIIFLNLIDDSLYNLFTKTYAIPQDKCNTLQITELLKFFDYLKSVTLYQTYTPLKLAFQNNLTFQNYFINFFIQDLYISKFVLTAQENTLRTLNLFGLLYNQHLTQDPQIALLNAALSPHNISLYYQSPEIIKSNNSLYGPDFGIFTKLFGVSVSDISNIIFENAPENTDSAGQELALLIGLRIVLDYFHENLVGLERLCNNFISAFDLIQADIYKPDNGVLIKISSKDNLEFCIDPLGPIDFWRLRVNTRYHTEFWPDIIKANSTHILDKSIALAKTLQTEVVDTSSAGLAKILIADERELILKQLDSIATQLSLSEATKFAKITYKIDKILTLQKHAYNDVTILNPQNLTFSYPYGSIQKHNYNLWCYFQHKAQGAAVLSDPAFIYKAILNHNPSDITSKPLYYQDPLATALDFDLRDQALIFAIVSCCDLIKDPYTGVYNLDVAHVKFLHDLLGDNLWARQLVYWAFEQCLNILEPFYLKAETPLEAYYTTETLINFMVYFVRGVLLNPNPALFLDLPHNNPEDSITSLYQPFAHHTLYTWYLDDIVKPLRIKFNEHFGYDRFITTNELLVYLLTTNATIQDFVAKFGWDLLAEFLHCAKNLWILAQNATEFKLTDNLQPASIFENEKIASKSNDFLAQYLLTCLDPNTNETDRNITGPYSYIGFILQQLQLLGVTKEQVAMIQNNHNHDIAKYECLFNIYCDQFKTEFMQEFVKTRFNAIKGTTLGRTDKNFVLHFQNNMYWDSNFKYNYLSSVTNNLLFFDIESIFVFDDFITSIISGLLFNNQSVMIAFIVLILSILFFIFPLISNIKLIPLNWQYVMENIYKFILNILNAQVGKIASPFFPYVFSVFTIILIANIAGMTLYAFTLTSHILVTFTLGVSSFLGLTILGFYVQKLAFLNLFLPKGIPTALIPILLVVEVISYVSRALSLSIRLFANLMSGHTLLHILAFFSSKLFKFKYIIGLLSFLLILAIVVLEFCIAMLQAYVFAILICIYLNDSFHGGH